MGHHWRLSGVRTGLVWVLGDVHAPRVVAGREDRRGRAAGAALGPQRGVAGLEGSGAVEAERRHVRLRPPRPRSPCGVRGAIHFFFCALRHNFSRYLRTSLFFVEIFASPLCSAMFTLTLGPGPGFALPSILLSILRGWE